jgi:hypothetical protein
LNVWLGWRSELVAVLRDAVSSIVGAPSLGFPSSSADKTPDNIVPSSRRRSLELQYGDRRLIRLNCKKWF